VDAEKLEIIARQIGDDCEVVADLPPRHSIKDMHGTSEDILSMLKRRPCSLNDISSGLGIPPNEALKHITELQHRGLIDSEVKNDRTFFKASST
jgi:predicted ArsR family transcriptional regulator